MQKKIVLFLITFLFQTKVLAYSFGDLSAPMCSKDDGDVSNVQSCLNELCGSPAPEKSMRLTNNNFDEYFESLVPKNKKEELLNELKVKIKSFVKNHNDASGELNELLRNGGIDYNFDKWSSSQFWALERQVFPETFERKIDYSAPLDKRLKIIFKEKPTWLSEDEFQEGVKEYFDNMKKEMLRDDRMKISYKILSVDESKKLLKDKWESIKSLLSDSYRSSLDSNKSKLLKELEDLLLTTQEGKEEDKLGRLSWLINEFVGFLGKKKAPRISTSFCSGDKCKRIMSKYLNKVILPKYTKQKIERIKFTDAEVENEAITCLSNYIMNKERKKRADSFRKILPEILENFLKNAMSTSSEVSKQKFKDFFQNEVNIVLETDYFNESSLQERLNIVKSGGDPSVVLAGLSEVLKKPINFMKECSSQTYIRDKVETLTGTPSYHLSYFTCSNHAVGKGIASHELGHLLSYALSQGRLSDDTKDVFLKERSCITHRNLVSLPKSNSHFSFAGDHLRSEEDMADYLSVRTYPRGQLHFCSLLNLSEDKTSYIDTFGTQAVDEHSDPIIRVIWEAVQKGSLPRQCKEALNNNFLYDIKKCSK